jgi:hypothetical protein
VLGDVGRLAAAVGIDMKDAFSLFEHFNPGQALPQRCRSASAPASGISRRSRRGDDVAAAVRVPG